MLLKNTLISLGLLTFTATVSAHTSIIEEEIIEGERTYLTVQVPHGCDHSPTTKVLIEMPNAQDDLDNDWAFTSVQPVLSWFKTETETDRDTGQVTDIKISEFSLPSPYVLKTQFRGKAPILPNGVNSEKIYFDIIQICNNGEVKNWNPSVTVVKARAENNNGGH